MTWFVALFVLYIASLARAGDGTRWWLQAAGIGDSFPDSDSNHMSISSIPNIPPLEMNALYDLYESTDGENWEWANTTTRVGMITHTNGVPWNFSAVNANPCTDNWQGLNCSFIPPYTTYHIAEIVLVKHNLRGFLPDTIGNFSRLRYFNLDFNHLNGSLPVSLRHLTQLAVISLAYNNFAGTVPVAYQSLSLMTEIFINHNRLSGSFPRELAGLFHLQTIGLDHNFFTGTIPDSITSFPDLKTLYIDVNGFDGSLPDALCEVTTLSGLHLSSNYFTGTIPPCLRNLTRLEELELHYNAFTGTIPEDLGMLTNLQLLYLHENQLTGTIPATIGDLVSLQNINLHGNRLTGPIPASFGNLFNLTNLYLENNYLSGTLAPALGGLRAMIFMYLSANMLHGSLPVELSLMTHLTSLFVDSNFFDGSLEGVFNSTTQPFITTIQVSDNQFTGSIPAEVFRVAQLSTFAAVSNCFDGSIPLSVCNSSSLNTLILDGLRSSTNCRETIMPGASSRYILSNRIAGGVPRCLFELENLRTLHVSGNGLTGSLPGDVNIRSNLLDLSVSHNEMTGTIPTAFQQKRWYNLDLSYNRFTGSLSLNEEPITGNATVKFYNLTLDADNIALTLRNNRLSGNLPKRIDSLQNISVLSGNLFACDLAQDDLPAHDESKSTYQCGSNSFNISYYIWISTLCFFIGGGFLVLWFRDYLIASLRLDRVAFYYDKWMHHIEFRPDRHAVVTTLKNYKYLMYVCGGVCQVATFCTLFIVVFLIPIYAASSAYYGTHEFEYAWSVSAAFLSGTPAMSMLLVSFVLLLAVAFALFTVHIRTYIREQKEFFRSPPGGVAPVARHTRGETDKTRVQTTWWVKGAVYFLFFLINCTVVLGVNVAYVYIRLYQPSGLLFIAQLALSVFKIVWNGMCSVYIIRWTDHYLAQSSSDDWKEKESGFFAIQLFVALFNYIAIPCLVVAVISPDCYTNLLLGLPQVSSHFEFYECELFSAELGCLKYSPKATSTSYDPPFTYSYQCSSSLVTFYAPTFVYLSFIVTFISPVVTLAMQKMHQYTRRGKWWSGQLDYWIPLILQPVSQATEEGKAPYDILNPYLDANLLLVTVMTYLAVMLTFGVVFPPLAPCLLVTLFSAVYSTKLEVGRFTTNAIAEGLNKYVEIIEEECEGAGSIPKLRQSVRLLLVFSLCFYTPFLFDTLGDAVGLARSVWVLFILPLIVVFLLAVKYALKKFLPNFLRSPLEGIDDRHSHLHAVEMHSVDSSQSSSKAGDSGILWSSNPLELNRIESGDSSNSVSSAQVIFNVLQDDLRTEIL